MKNKIYNLLLIIFVFIYSTTPSIGAQELLPYITVEYTGGEQIIGSTLYAKDINVTLYYYDDNGTLQSSEVGSIYYTISNNAIVNNIGINEFLITLNNLNYMHYIGLNTTFNVTGIENPSISKNQNFNLSEQNKPQENIDNTKNAEENTTPEDETKDVKEPILGYAEIISSYSIKIPKTISIDSKSKDATYTIICTNFSENIDYISITPQTSFEMYQPNKEVIEATIKQSHTTFKNTEEPTNLDTKEVLMSNQINGLINIPDLSAGSWIGEFSFIIESKEKPYTDFVLNSTNIEMPNLSVENGDLIIPEYFEYEDERYKIIKIEDNAFINRHELETLVIPPSVEEIGSNAFANCSSLKSIVLPPNIVVEENAFQHCTELTEVNLEGITIIKDNAFLGCSKLTSISITSGTTIGKNAFQYCTSLKNIEFKGRVQIDDFAFFGCLALKEITLPEGLETINNSIFYNCSGLTTVNLPSTIKSIGEDAFKYCSVLNRINLPNGLTTIESGAFYNCGQLELTIPDSVTTIGRDAFMFIQKIYYYGNATYENDNVNWGALNRN